MFQKKYHTYIIVVSNVIIGFCALVLGKWTAMHLLKTDTTIGSCQRSMQAGSGAISARAFAFDHDIAMGRLDSAKPHIHRKSIEYNLRAVILQYGIMPKQKSSVFLKRDIIIKGGTRDQIEAYKKLLVELDLATTQEQRTKISKKIDKILGKAESDRIVNVFGVVY